MSAMTNRKRLNNLLKGMQKSIDLFDSQGYGNVYFTAQFLRNGKKQNGIERGDISAFASQIRTYVNSEEADGVRVEFIDEHTGKSIYSKALTDLQSKENGYATPAPATEPQAGLNGFAGLGEVQINAIVDKRVSDIRMQDESQRMSRELETLRSRNTELESENEELEATLKAKKDNEYYMGILGMVFPGLANLLQGTKLANVANFLAGTADVNGKAIDTEHAPAELSEEQHSLATMISEFCAQLNPRQISIVHLLFATFEKDMNQMERIINIITQTPTTS